VKNKTITTKMLVAASITYCDLTQREYDAYINALYHIRNKESITKTKGR
jgi:hypothetical protein